MPSRCGTEREREPARFTQPAGCDLDWLRLAGQHRHRGTEATPTFFHCKESAFLLRLSRQLLPNSRARRGRATTAKVHQTFLSGVFRTIEQTGMSALPSLAHAPRWRFGLGSGPCLDAPRWGEHHTGGGHARAYSQTSCYVAHNIAGGLKLGTANTLRWRHYFGGGVGFAGSAGFRNPSRPRRMASNALAGSR